MDVTSLFENVGASATGSIISKLACYPLDTIAVHYQTSTRRPLLSIPLKAYYRGIGVTILTVTPATALYLTTREAAQIALLPHLGDGALNDAASGCLAELAGSVLFTPMEVLKARLQISSHGEEGKLLYQLRDIARKEGFRGFYRGYVMGIVSYMPYNVLWWTTYGNIRRSMPDRSIGTQITCGAGAAAMISAAFIHPLELVKTRYQVATSDTVAAVGSVAGTRSSDQEGLRQVVRNVMKESGPKGFYAGFFPTLLRSVPSSIIMMLVFENLKAKRRVNAESAL
ncbi:mitochondrial carrier [Mollisia scopiformis]|uniref:Mitochondrial carrier n=1 Tax=Mollisia scopiformis TaxID=149040 RepID=A0A194X350_MOLSC|nr:mitochondrial carrier [Mollisia scopiformis]KUJ14449.1 mitochondrial carrier [Mollisia scopiformis]